MTTTKNKKPCYNHHQQIKSQTNTTIIIHIHRTGRHKKYEHNRVSLSPIRHPVTSMSAPRSRPSIHITVLTSGHNTILPKNKCSQSFLRHFLAHQWFQHRTLIEPRTRSGPDEVQGVAYAAGFVSSGAAGLIQDVFRKFPQTELRVLADGAETVAGRRVARFFVVRERVEGDYRDPGAVALAASHHSAFGERPNCY